MTQDPSATVQIIDTRLDRAPLAVVRGTGAAHAVLRGSNGAHFRTFNTIELGAGSSTVDLCHGEECAWYITTGSGAVRDLTDDSVQPLIEGSMIHIGRGDRYRVEAGAEGLSAVWGTVPLDPAFYESYLEAEA